MSSTQILHQSIDLKLKLKQFSFFFIDLTTEYLSHAVLLICDKGTNDSQLFLVALDTLISFVTDPICQLRMSLDKSNSNNWSFPFFLSDWSMEKSS